MKRIAVVGAGASGLIAACFAAGKKREVVVFEKQKKIGRKILVTGNGRCNISNRFINTSHYHGANPEFVNNIFGRFGLDETIDFFKTCGVPFVETKDGKLFPASLQASTIVRIFEYELQKRGVTVMLHRRIDSITKKDGRFSVVTAGKERFTFDSVVLAAGSCAYSPVGASKIGYDLAESIGHSIVDLFPSLLPLNVIEKNIRVLQGVKRDCALSVMLNGKILGCSEGELLFTSYGISGPAALDISRVVNEQMLCGTSPVIQVDFFPEYSDDELTQCVEELWIDGSKGVGFSLAGIINEKIPGVILKSIGIEPRKKVFELSKKDRKTIVYQMKNFQLIPGEPRGFKEAVVAAGGVDVRDIDPGTMESKLVKNLYLTGELLDIDGDSGGFNLQFAWSTGALAGMAQ